MTEPNGSRRDFLTIAALNPVDNSTCEVFVSFDRMQAVGRRSLGQAKESGYIVPEILQRPTAVFEGLRRDEDEDRGQPAGGATAVFPLTRTMPMGRRLDRIPA